jgi:ABC-2 type transport system permease protein
MKKILLIIKREYLTRVRKRSFIVMTILGPLLMAAIVIVPLYIASISNEVKAVSVIDETGFFYGKFKDSESVKFQYLYSDLETAKTNFSKSGAYAILYIPKTELAVPSSAFLYSKNQVNMNVKGYVRSVMTRQIEELKLEQKLKDIQPGLDAKLTTTDILKSIQASVEINTIKIGKQGDERSYPEVSFILGLFSGILIYFFIFLFGSQVMRGVIEEKTSRIVEVIISSVKPFQLMMGKIIGVGLVGLTQFLLWVILTAGIVTTVATSLTSKSSPKKIQEQMMKTQKPGITPIAPLGQMDNATDQNGDNMNEVLDAVNSIDFPVMIGSFLFFFLFGFLLYAALFAAIGSSVDSESDTQQFMLPITVPLVLSIVLAQYIIQEPQGPMAFWFSIIPLTSPVIMMIRIPFGVPYAQLALSMGLLILGFLGTTWVAAKIYRTGILMYGKRVNYRELWKWLKYRN